LKRLIGIVLTAIILAGCTTSQAPPAGEPEVATTSKAKATEEPVVIKSRYPACDSIELQPVTRVSNSDWKAFQPVCQTDQTQETPALTSNLPENNVQRCQLIETSWERARYEDAYPTGFPRAEGGLEDGNYKIAVIPVQYPDIKGDGQPLDFTKPAAEMMSKYYEVFTRGKVSFDWEFYGDWITIDQPSENFSQSETQQNTAQHGEENTSVVDRFWNAALSASDPFVDFTGVDMVFFILPRNQDVSQEFNLWPPSNGPYQTDEGKIYRGFTPGSYQFRPDKNLWAFWAHETMHYFRVPDLYWHSQNSVKRSDFTLSGPFKGLDIMDNQDGVTKSLSGWPMWLAGWMTDDEVFCLTDENFQETSFVLTPVSIADTSLKTILIRMSDTQAIAIESRRSTEFDVDKPANRSREGVLVYHIDTSFGNGAGPMTALAPEGRTLIYIETKVENDFSLDSILYKGNSISIGGYVITVNESTEFTDTVSITRDQSWVSGDEPTYVCYSEKNRDLSVEYPGTCPITF
jgi:M6 family metalloprotease-like protein